MANKNQPVAYARIHVLMARSALYGVVMRRGPSKQVCTIGWDREHDTFQIGQWLKGRIYERRCDLSPDGKRMIYFAMNGKWQSDVGGSWTAISRAPYLNSDMLEGKGDCWHGGGLFMDNETYWINDGYGHKVVPGHAPFDFSFKENNYLGECPGVYYPRLKRDGWVMTGKTDTISSFEKELWGGWILRKQAYATIDHPPGKGCYYDEHELIHTTRGKAIRHPDWEWAERDRDRLVWAEKGCLYTGTLNNDGLAEIQLLRDFNDMVFEPIKAPY